MNRDWLPHTLLSAASLLTPGDRRAEWLREWQSELWYVPGPGATRFCLGAFRDALWLRRNRPTPVKRLGVHLESPLACLAWLIGFAVLSSLAVVCLPTPHRVMPVPHLRARDLPEGWLAMLMITGLMLPPLWLAMKGNPQPRPGKLRRGLFLALKIALVQPFMLCGFVGFVWMAPMVPIVAQMMVFATWALTFRWVLLDQRRRCPVCLRLLTEPVRIGTPSGTFLEWYGAGAMCPCGHGMLETPEAGASFSGRPQWLRLDA